MTHCVTYVLCALLAVATPASPQQAEWKDPSPHAVKRVTVDMDVQLEVLDWGGSGRALVLLAGGAIRRTCSTILRRHWPRGTASLA